MASARVRLPSDLDGLMRSQMLTCIEEANLGQTDTQVAKRYLIDQWAQIEIAAELGCVKSTVLMRMPRILSKVQATAKKLNMV